MNGNISNATCKCNVSSFFTDCSIIKNLSKDCQFYMHELIDIGLDKVLCIILNSFPDLLVAIYSNIGLQEAVIHFSFLQNTSFLDPGLQLLNCTTYLNM